MESLRQVVSPRTNAIGTQRLAISAPIAPLFPAITVEHPALLDLRGGTDWDLSFRRLVAVRYFKMRW